MNGVSHIHDDSSIEEVNEVSDDSSNEGAIEVPSQHDDPSDDEADDDPFTMEEDHPAEVMDTEENPHVPDRYWDTPASGGTSV